MHKKRQCYYNKSQLSFTAAVIQTSNGNISADVIVLYILLLINNTNCAVYFFNCMYKRLLMAQWVRVSGDRKCSVHDPEIVGSNSGLV